MDCRAPEKPACLMCADTGTLTNRDWVASPDGLCLMHWVRPCDRCNAWDALRPPICPPRVIGVA